MDRSRMWMVGPNEACSYVSYQYVTLSGIVIDMIQDTRDGHWEALYRAVFIKQCAIDEIQYLQMDMDSWTLTGACSLLRDWDR